MYGSHCLTGPVTSRTTIALILMTARMGRKHVDVEGGGGGGGVAALQLLEVGGEEEEGKEKAARRHPEVGWCAMCMCVVCEWVCNVHVWCVCAVCEWVWVYECVGVLLLSGILV